MLEEGTDAPGFALPDQRGETVSLSEFAGRRVVVYFYPRANTPGCTREATGFQDHLDAFRDRDTVVIGISDDPVDRLAEFADDHSLDFHLLSDEDGTVADAYESYGERTIQDETFEIAFRNTYVIGPDGRIERAYEGVAPDGHARQVLDDLDELAD